MKEGFSSPFWLHRNSSGGGIILFARQEIRSNILSEYKPNTSVENIFIEIKLSSTKCLLSCSCNRNLTLLNYHIQNISRSLDFYSPKYDNFIAHEDFNAETSNTTELFAIHNLKNLIKEPTCFRNLLKPNLYWSYLYKSTKMFSKLKCFWN